MTLRKLFLAAAVAAFGAACGDGGTGPGDNALNLAVQSGDQQFGAPSLPLADPLQVIVTDPISELPRENVTVTWTVVSGTGATLLPASTVTDANGVASTMLRLGSSLGDYIVEATAEGMSGSKPRFTARAVNPPSITNAPAVTNVGDTIIITGANFSSQGDDNIVLFGGFRGKVVSATTTQLRVVVPICVPARMVAVTALLGAVSGNSVNMEVRGAATSSLQLARGEARTISDPAELACFRLPGGISGYTVLLVPQNFSDVAGSRLGIQLAGLSGQAPVASTTFAQRRATMTDVAGHFEMMLREREQKLIEQLSQPISARPQAGSVAACPNATQVGQSCNFQVFNKDEEFVTVTATVKASSARALVFQDVNAPAGGLSEADFQTLARVFDDPIYNAGISAFGNPSDQDGNGKVIILLTPVVNAMTPRGSNGFIAGFFYGCDLVGRALCSGTNSGEIFYTLAADPGAQFGDARTVSGVMRSLPPVIAHEFQHMIHFGQRSKTDALWLSEGLAHHAEDIVADAFAARGDATTAEQFRSQNYVRANRYLRDPSGTSLIAESGVGTLELRGAAWLFVKYLEGQYGTPILKALTAASESSVTNVEKQTGKSWSALLANWAIALYADDAPALAGVTVSRELTFPNVNLRAVLGGSNFPLRPVTESFVDFVLAETLPASSQLYVIVQASAANPSPFSLNLAGQYGGGFPVSGVPQLSILRIQ